MRYERFYDADEVLDAVAAELGLAGGRRGEMAHYETVWNAAHPDMPYPRLDFGAWFMRDRGQYGNGSLVPCCPRDELEDLAERYGPELRPWREDDGGIDFLYGWPDGPWLAEPLAALRRVAGREIGPGEDTMLIRVCW